MVLSLQDILGKRAIISNLSCSNKKQALNQMGKYLCSIYSINDPVFLIQRILDREAEASTGIGFGIAIPHARIESVESVKIIAARSLKGIDFEAIDDKPVHIIFMVVTPKNSKEHTKVLTLLSNIMSHEDIREKIIAAETSDLIMKHLIDGENRYAPGKS